MILLGICLLYPRSNIKHNLNRYSGHNNSVKGRQWDCLNTQACGHTSVSLQAIVEMTVEVLWMGSPDAHKCLFLHLSRVAPGFGFRYGGDCAAELNTVQ